MSQVFASGLLLLMIAFIYYNVKQAEKGNVPQIRELPTVEAISEVVGRAAEMGSSVHYSTGGGGLTDQYAAMTISALEIMGEVAKVCGEMGVEFRYTCSKSQLVPIAQDLIKAGYIQAGNDAMYHDGMVVYVGEQQRALMAECLSYMLNEKPAGNMMFGAGFWETEVIMGAGAVVGAMQIGGTPRLYHAPTFVMTCSYALIGEELYVAGALVGKADKDLGAIKGVDWFKFVCLGLIGLSAILSTAGSTLFQYLLSV